MDNLNFETDFSSALSEEPPKYSHGYSEEEVFRIKNEREKLYSEKIAKNIPLSLSDMKDVIVPFVRIHRVETFILNEKPEKEKKERKVKVKEPGEIKEVKAPKAPKEQKEKKLTKAFIKKELDRIIMKMCSEMITDEEQKFLTEHSPKLR